MRSKDVQQLGMFSYVSVEQRVPADHPIRKLRLLVDMILKELDPLLAQRYLAQGRPSIPPERLLRASLLQVIYSVRSERLLMEQLDLQPAVPLVRRPKRRRSGVGSLDVLFQPRPPVRCRSSAALL